MRISFINGSINFKSRRSDYDGCRVPQGSDYSTVGEGQALTKRGKAQLQKNMRNGVNIPKTRESIILAEMPKTLDYIGAYCPDCGGIEADDLTQEALLALVEQGKINKKPTLPGFERKVRRVTKRELAQVIGSETRYKRDCLPMSCIPEVPVSLEDCQRRYDNPRKEAMYELLEGVLKEDEIHVIEGLHINPAHEKKSIDQIAQELGVSNSKVVDLNRVALEKLRRPDVAKALGEIAGDDFFVM